jgi:hypothetical protein
MLARLSVLISLLFVLAGCDNPITCPKPCPNPKEKRDFFCGCFDPEENKQKNSGKNQDSGSSAAFASCVCQYSSGLVGAYFSFPPGAYGSMSPVRVSASGCSDLTLCELMPTQTGDQYQYYTGLMTIRPTNWVKHENYITGGSIWYVLGRMEQQKAEAPVDGRKYLSRLASIYLRSQRQIHPAQFVNNAAGCQGACDAGSPYCFSQDISGIEAQGLRRLHSAILSSPKTIPSSTLKSMFNVSHDPCERGDTSFESNRLVNRGHSCDMSARIPSIDVTATISVPSVLDGQNTIRDQRVVVTFDEPAMRPRLKFSDANLNADWGGDIVSVYGDSQSIGFSIGAQSCLRFNLK